jgi:hypothetical protein
MAQAGIAAIFVGAILFPLGLFPSLLPALMERFQSLRDRFVLSRERIQKIQSDLPLHSDAWLLGGGGVMLILGLLAVLC